MLLTGSEKFEFGSEIIDIEIYALKPGEARGGGGQFAGGGM